MNLLDTCAYLVLGQVCVGCRVSGPELLCESCRAQLAALPRVSGGAFPDVGVAARLVRRGKAGDSRGAARLLAEAGAARIASHIIEGRRDSGAGRIDLVTWVPPAPWRARRRGEHLPERFARACGKLLEVPAVQLVRRRDMRPQRLKSRAERLALASGSYEMLSNRPRARQRVMLVDDVRATGATLRAVRFVLACDYDVVAAFALVAVESESSLRPAKTGSRNRA